MKGKICNENCFKCRYPDCIVDVLPSIRKKRYDRIKNWRVKNKEKFQACCKRYYQRHKEKRQAYNKKYYQEHKEKYQEYYKKYYQEHKEEIAIKTKIYRQRIKEREKQYRLERKEKNIAY